MFDFLLEYDRKELLGNVCAYIEDKYNLSPEVVVKMVLSSKAYEKLYSSDTVPSTEKYISWLEEEGTFKSTT